MKTYRNICALRKDLSIIFISSLLIIIAHDFILIKIIQQNNFLIKLFQIIYNLCFSYISAFIFYYLVVHLKTQKDKENLYKYVSKNISLILGQAISVSRDLAEKANIQVESKYPNSEELNVICSKINPKSNAPLLLGFNTSDEYANWIQYFEINRLNTIQYSDKILTVTSFIDSELVRKILRIQDCSHFHLAHICTQIKNYTKEDLTNFTNSLVEYFEFIKDLDIYSEEQRKKYK